MRLDGTRKELRVELYPDHPGMVDVLHYLHLSAGRADPGDLHSGGLKLFDVLVVELKAVTVALLDLIGAVYPFGF